MCSKSNAKLFLFFLNAVFFLCAAGLIAIGIFFLVDEGDTLLKVFSHVPSKDNLSTEDLQKILQGQPWLQKASYIVIACGTFIFIISLCGCLGSLRENKSLLSFYSITLVILLIIEIAGGVFCFMYRKNIENYSKKYLHSTIELLYVGSTLSSNGELEIVAKDDISSYAWDWAMVEYECCGVESYEDFTVNSTKWPRNNTYTEGGSGQMAVPVACCKMENPDLAFSQPSAVVFTDLTRCIQSASPNATHTGGCFKKFKDIFERHSSYLAISAVAIAFLQILALCAVGAVYGAPNKVDVME